MTGVFLREGLQRCYGTYRVEGVTFSNPVKELFVNPEAAIRLLKETLGDPNCRVVVSLKRAMDNTHTAGKNVKRPICLKRIVLHNPQKQTYCVMVYDGKELKLVSWNNAGDDYGNEEWTLK